MSRLVKYLLVLLALVLMTCKGAGDRAEDQSAEVLPAFATFPVNPFYDIAFGDELPVVEQKLAALGFVKIDSSGAYYFLHEADSMELILPDENPVSSFKVFLRSDYYLNSYSILRETFTATAESAEFGAGFEVYGYRLDELEYKMTAFSQPDYIRLNYEQRLPK